MKQGADKEQRRAQREVLIVLYQDYNPRHHDIFVQRYNDALERAALDKYLFERGIITKDATHA